MKNKLFTLILIPILVLTSCNKKPKYSKGVVTDGVYYSEFLKLQFTPPSGYNFLSGDKIKELVNDVTVMFDAEEFINSDDASLIEFFALNENSGCNANLTIGKCDKDTNIDTFIKDFRKKTVNSYDSMGLICNFIDPIDYTLGENFNCKKLKALFSYSSMVQYIYVSMIENYACVIACTDAWGTREAMFEAAFSDYAVD